MEGSSGSDYDEEDKRSKRKSVNSTTNNVDNSSDHDDDDSRSKSKSETKRPIDKESKKKKKKKKSRKPSNSAFKQQRLRACQPILTPIPVIISLILVAVIFIPVGVIMIITSEKIVEIQQRYDHYCGDVGQRCNITIDVNDKMGSPVYVYYKLTNYYQNHRSYVKSRADKQLRGDHITSYTDLADCTPQRSVGGSHDESTFFIPCGLIAYSFFNDTYEMKDPNGNYVPWKKQGIAWTSDKDHKFDNPPQNQLGVHVVKDFKDEDFIVWMRTAGLPTFKKLYRIIHDDLETGKYSFEIQNNYPVDEFDGEKWIVLSTVSWMGGRNPFLGATYIAVGGLSLIIALIFLLKHLIKPRKLGDERYLNWNKK